MGIWGEVELILRIWGAKEKYFQRAGEFSFRDLGRSMQYFQGPREHIPLGASILLSNASQLDSGLQLRTFQNAHVEHAVILLD